MRPGLTAPACVTALALSVLSFAPPSVRASTIKYMPESIEINNSGTVHGTVHVSTLVGALWEHSSYGFIRASDGTTSTYEIPGAMQMFVDGINASGAVAGSYTDGQTGHAFIRAPDGTITTFKVPGDAGPGTYATSINDRGDVSGSYFDASHVKHGFVRSKSGALTTFRAGDDTQVVDMNQAGDVVGYATIGREGNSPEKILGFVRKAQGETTPFEVSGAPYTEGHAVLSSGVVAGNSTRGAFLRSTEGTITLFDGRVQAMNSRGTITGTIRDASNVRHGLVRASDGTVETFDIPGADTGFNGGPVPSGINARGEIVGTYSQGGQSFGFVRAPDGTITTFGVPEHPVAYTAATVEDQASVQQSVVELAKAAIRGPSVLRRGGTAELEYSLPEAADVALVVYDVMGRQVANIAQGPRSAGTHRASWGAATPGMYFYRLRAGSLTATRSVVVTP